MNHFQVANQEHWHYQIQKLHNLTKLITINTLQPSVIRTEIISILGSLIRCPPSFHLHLISNGLIETSEILITHFQKDPQVPHLLSLLLASLLRTPTGLLNPSLAPLLAAFLRSPSEEPITACLRLLEDHLSLEDLLQLDLLEAALVHLTSPSRTLQQLLLQFLLKLIKDSSEDQIQHLFNLSLVRNLSKVLEAPKDPCILNSMLALLYSLRTFRGIDLAFSELLPHVLVHLPHISPSQQKLALVVLMEYTGLLNDNQVRYLVEHGIIDLLIPFLESSSDLIVNTSLECLVNIVRTGSLAHREPAWAFNLYTVAIQESISLDKLLYLRSVYYSRRTRALLDQLIQELQTESNEN